jgi:tetratricopeptide (TPR) repeat protein
MESQCSRYLLVALLLLSSLPGCKQKETPQPEPAATGDRKADVTVAILDSGVPAELDPRFHLICSHDFTGEGIDDVHGHSTGVVMAMLTGIAQVDKSKMSELLGVELPQSEPVIGLIFIKVIDRFGQTTPERVLKGVQVAAEEKADIVIMSLNVWLPPTEARPYFEVLEGIVKESRVLWTAAWPNDAKEKAGTNLQAFPSESPLIHAVGVDEISGESVSSGDFLKLTRDHYADYYFCRGNERAAAGEHEQAIELYLIGLNFNRSSTKLAINLGAAYRNKGDFEAAVGSFMLALDADPRSGEAYYNLSSTYQAMRDPTTAIKFGRKMAEVVPEYAPGQSLLGTLLADNGAVEEGIVHSRKAVSLEPNDVKFNYNLSRLLLMNDETDEAISYASRAVELDGSYAPPQFVLGIAKSRLHDNKGAIRHLGNAVRLDPTMSAAHWHLSVIEFELGELGDANSHYDIAVELDPSLSRKAHPLLKQ